MLPLCIAGLRVSGDDGRRLIEVERLEVAGGACVGVRGPSGAGKSTLLYAMAGLLRRVSGSVRWGETEMVALSGAAAARFRRQHLGMVFQDAMLFDELSAEQNGALKTAFAPRREREAIAEGARRRLEGLGVRLGGRRVASYSGGERQRVSVARALAGEPKIVLADEPTASLDRQAANALVDDVLALVRQRGMSLIAASHDEALLDRMDRVLTIDNGELVAP